MISPHADSGFTVVSESGTALVPGGLSVPAIPENVAFLLVGEDTVESRAMGRADSWLELRPLAAVDVVEVVAVFGYVMRIESKVVWTFERLLAGCACNRDVAYLVTRGAYTVHTRCNETRTLCFKDRSARSSSKKTPAKQNRGSWVT